MRVLQSISRPGKAGNEDAAGARPGGLWVVDGATPLTDEPPIDGRSPAAWLARTADAFLSQTPWTDQPLRDVVRQLIEHARVLGRHAGLDVSTFPTATLSLARLSQGPSDLRLELCLLGDSPVVVRRPGETAVEFVDPQFVGVEEALLDRLRPALDRGDNPGEVYAQARAASRERRVLRNTPAGLWVLADVPAAADHTFVVSIPVVPGTEVVAMSDGFARAVHPFGLVAGVDELLDEVAAGHADALLDRVRAAERVDPDCIRFPRFGRSDDATMVHAQV